MTMPALEVVSGATGGATYGQAELIGGVFTNDPTLALSGTASDALSGLALTTLGGLAVPVSAGAWSTTVTLSPGVNTLSLLATDRAGNSRPLVLTVAYTSPTGVTKQHASEAGPRTKGFWTNAVATGQYPQSQIDALLAAVNVGSRVFGVGDPWGAVLPENYTTILSDTSSTEAKFRGQLLATWLNVVSGKLALGQPVELKTVAGWKTVVINTGGSSRTTAGNAIGQMEARRLGNQISAYGVAQSIAEGLNSLKLELYGV